MECTIFSVPCQYLACFQQHGRRNMCKLAAWGESERRNTICYFSRNSNLADQEGSLHQPRYHIPCPPTLFNISWWFVFLSRHHDTEENLMHCVLVEYKLTMYLIYCSKNILYCFWFEHLSVSLKINLKQRKQNNFQLYINL